VVPAPSRPSSASARNAGPLKLIPSTVTEELPGDFAIEKPSPPAPNVGSGKFGTLWARMHLASANWGLVPDSDPEAVFGLELPHAATTTAQHTATSATPMARHEPHDGSLRRATTGITGDSLMLSASALVQSGAFPRSGRRPQLDGTVVTEA
jgi:hypothetical protein